MRKRSVALWLKEREALREQMHQEMLDQMPATMAQIIERTGLSRETVRGRLRDMEQLKKCSRWYSDVGSRRTPIYARGTNAKRNRPPGYFTKTEMLEMDLPLAAEIRRKTDSELAMDACFRLLSSAMYGRVEA